MDLTTHYLGLKLKNPLMPGASPLVDDLDAVRRLEDAGASAIVMHSLFEEQVVGEQLASIYAMEMFADSYAEALSYFPRHDDFALSPDESRWTHDFSRVNLAGLYEFACPGEMPERSNGAVSKTAVPATVPGVRIPLSPPFSRRFESALGFGGASRRFRVECA